MTSTRRVDLLAIPELILLIGKRLDRHSLTTCLRVCRHWQQLLLVFVWSNVDRPVPFPALVKHSLLIRQLLLVEEDDFFPTFEREEDPTATTISTTTFPNLSALNIQKSRSYFYMYLSRDAQDSDLAVHGTPDENAQTHRLNFLATEQFLIRFFQRHAFSFSTLYELVMSGPISFSLLDAVASSCSGLEQLRIENMLLNFSPEEWIILYPRLWSRLRVLTLYGDWYFLPDVDDLEDDDEDEDDSHPRPDDSGIWHALEALESTRIEKLKLVTPWSDDTNNNTPQAPLFLIQKSPGLTHLAWSAMRHPFNEHPHDPPVAQLARSAERGLLNCPRLESLSLPGTGRIEVRADDFIKVLGALPSLTKLDLHDAAFEHGCFTSHLQQQLPRYLVTLRELNLLGCGGLHSTDIHVILRTISSLEVFKADEILEQDFDSQRHHRQHQQGLEQIAKDRPWVCLGLRELDLAYSRSSVTARTDRLFLDQVATLTMLEILRLNTDHVYGGGGGGGFKYPLELTLDRGMDVLKTLSRLKELQGPRPRPCWGQSEANWVSEHWTKLEILSGVVLTTEAKSIMRNSKIDISGCSPFS
ncbi:hypothetical protein BGZ83_010518 [Gryganskiella cystojenkinii]|nr:hypothetical protein BGZ83_010518 [Gryganskiella cystojenkinii]